MNNETESLIRAKPRIRYNSYLQVWLCKSEDSPYTYFGSDIKSSYEAWLVNKHFTFQSMADNVLDQIRFRNQLVNSIWAREEPKDPPRSIIESIYQWVRSL